MDENVSSLLDTDLSGVSLDAPLIVESIYELEIAGIKVEQNKAGDGQNMNVTLKLMSDAATVDGKTVHRGFGIYDTISLKETDKYDPRQNLKRLKVAALGGDGSGGFGDPATYIGKVVKAKVTIEKGGKNKDTGQEYPDRNRVRYLTK